MTGKKNVVPVYKTGDKQILNIYPPTLLLPVCGKIFEKLTHVFLIRKMSLKIPKTLRKSYDNFQPEMPERQFWNTPIFLRPLKKLQIE